MLFLAIPFGYPIRFHRLCLTDLEISVEKIRGVDGAAVVTVKGEIHATTVMPFQKKVNSTIDAGISKIIIDMEKVKYVNSTGLGYMINLRDTMEAKHGLLAFANIQPKVMVVFNMLGMLNYMKAFSTREQAVQAVSSGQGSAPPSPRAPAMPEAPVAPAPPRPVAKPVAAPRPEPLRGAPMAVPQPQRHPAASPPTPFGAPRSSVSLGRRILRAAVWTLLILIAVAAVSFTSIMIYRTTLPPSALRQ